MKISEIKEILNARVLWGEDCLQREAIAGIGADLMDEIASSESRDTVMLTGLTSPEVIRTARTAEVVCVVFVRGKIPDEMIVAQARSCDLPLLLTRHSMFMASGKLYMHGLRGPDGSW